MVKTRLVKIGNSQGIRIPKLLLQQTQLTDEVELDVEEGKLIVRSARPARQGWDAQFRAMAETREDTLLDNEVLTLTRWETEEWSW
ncbi:AbrB/MazE/SpoVT family DNA-binding domain-containing protein [Armatimonas sp.]|uniref:AbrB/MazE/SpoVT family DNA-binding domain-containing protein n=1 Tax=Armatimonas sp. TaxID=1872638 RepID=UPI00374D401E